MARLNALRNRLARPPANVGTRAAPRSDRVAAAVRAAAMGLLGMAIGVIAAAIPALYQRLAEPPAAVREVLAEHGVPVGASRPTSPGFRSSTG